jgi:ankyrin repeat protein
VACQLDLLSELPNDAAKRKALGSLPPTLFKTYERILERVNACDYSIQIMVQKALQLTVHCSSAKINAVCEAISVRDNDTSLDQESFCEKEDILMHCSSLLRISSSEDKFELAHFTVKEFLVGLSPSSNPSFAPYSQMKSYVHPILARTCLTYLRLDPFRGRVLEDLDEWEQQQSQYPFRRHAARTWVKYAKHAWGDATVQTLAHDLFSPSKSSHFLSWIRDYIYLESKDLFFIQDKDDGRDIFHAATKVMGFGSITPLHIAAAIGSLNLCQWLISLGCSINQRSSVGTPVHCVLLGIKRISSIVNQVSGLLGSRGWLRRYDNRLMKQGRDKVLDLFIGLGADFTLPYRTPDGSEYSCIELTRGTGIAMGKEHPLLKLVTTGVQLEDGFATRFMEDSEDSEDCNTEDSAKITIEALIAQLDKNPQTERVRSELFTIALQFQSSVASELFTSDVMSVDKLYDALESATRFDQTKIVEKLLQDARLDPLASHGGLGETLLHEAAAHEAVNTLKLLLSLGLDVDATDRQGSTALHDAVGKNSTTRDVVSLLLSHGASTTITDGYGQTAWHVAAECGNFIGLQTLSLLDKTKRGAQATPDKAGFIPIFLAAKEMHNSAFELLLFEAENLETLPRTCPDGLGLVHYAASLNSIKALRFLLDRGEQLDQKTRNGKTALHFIPANADLEVVQFLMDAGLKASTVTDDGSTPLHALIETEDNIEQTLFDILATEETIKLPNNEGLCVLHCTVSSTKNTQEINYPIRQRAFDILARKGADVHATDPTGKSCLQMAFELRAKEMQPKDNVISTNLRGFVTLIISIIELTTDLEVLNALVKVDTRSVRLINWAIEIAEEPLVDSLYSKGVDITLHNNGSGLESTWSTLETACYHNYARATFHRLLERSQGLQGLNKEGHSLAHLACMKPMETGITVLECLYDSGWDFDLGTAEKSWTPLMLASMAGKKEHVRFLLQRGTEFRSKDKFGWEAIHHAVCSGHLPVLREFVGSDIDWETSLLDFYAGPHRYLGSNILHLAAGTGNSKVLAEFIIENNLVRDINGLTENGYSPLHLAASLGWCETVTFLLQKGADIELEAGGRIRPIHLAVLENKLDNVKMLLSHGCLLVADEKGMTPEMYAVQRGFETIVDRLREYERGIRPPPLLFLQKSYNLFSRKEF